MFSRLTRWITARLIGWLDAVSAKAITSKEHQLSEQKLIVADCGDQEKNIFHQIIFSYLSFITRELFKITGGTVQTGPFSGMILNEKVSWGTGDISSKILGCYEEELHKAVEKSISRRPDIVINVGCAEGYYAIGMARRLPQAQIYAFDISETAQAICADTARRNGVSERIVVGGKCTYQTLSELTESAEKTLIIMDCEGDEINILNKSIINNFIKCDIIVECHDFINRSITPTILQLFTATHDIDIIQEGGRNPAAYPFLRSFGSLDRWLAVCEFRPEVMSWINCWSKD